LKLRKMDEAWAHAEQAAQVAGERDAGSRAAAHALLAKTALARRDADAAREQATLARNADPSLPMPAFIDGRLLYDQGRYEEALPFFEDAIAEIGKKHASPMPELHVYAAETLAHLADSSQVGAGERYQEAEAHYVADLRDFPQQTRARVGLATLYQATGRPEEAGRVLADMTRLAPTPESYAQAARLWKAFGNHRQSDAVRAEARRAFPSR
jgi:tetratricopeptide (TPR) repeat protein